MRLESLAEIAKSVRARAYAPYSKFSVGAAVAAQSGEIYAGCNVENISFGLTICAERVCMTTAIAAGETKFESLVLIADSENPVVPCGACRQFLAEFCQDLDIHSLTISGKIERFSLRQLLPKPKQGILGS